MRPLHAVEHITAKTCGCGGVIEYCTEHHLAGWGRVWLVVWLTDELADLMVVLVLTYMEEWHKDGASGF